MGNDRRVKDVKGIAFLTMRCDIASHSKIELASNAILVWKLIPLSKDIVEV